MSNSKAIFIYLLLFRAAVGCTDIGAHSSRQPYVVVGQSVNLRQAPSIGSPIVRVMAQGTPLQLLDFGDETEFSITDGSGQLVSGHWIKVRDSSGNPGYVFSPYFGIRLGADTLNALIFSAYPPSRNRIAGELIATVNRGFLRGERTPTGEPLTPQVHPAGPLRILDAGGRSFATAQNPRYTKDHNVQEAYSCTQSFMFEASTATGDAPSSWTGFALAGDLNPADPPFREATVSAETWNQAIANANGYVRQRPVRDTTFVSFGCGAGCLKKSFSGPDGSHLLFLTMQHRVRSSRISVFRVDHVTPSGPKNIYTNFRDLSGDATETEYFFAVTDLDANGLPEVWTKTIGWEWWYFRMYVLDLNRLIPVFRGGGGGC